MHYLKKLTFACLCLVWISAVAADEVPLNVHTEGLRYAEIIDKKLPVDKVLISSLNVKVGVHLERLTLI